MGKLRLKIDSSLQGDFEIKDLNLLLVFQVNCPGCFIYAIPQAVKLFDKYASDYFNILGLSTAFEDFDLNTVKNTNLLLHTCQLVGETQKFFKTKYLDRYPIKINFPVAFDKIGSSETLFEATDIEITCQAIPGFSQLSEENKIITRKKVGETLSLQPSASYTFTINQLPGTPTWLLFDSNFIILEKWFGHKSDVEVEAILTQSLDLRMV